MVTMKGTVVKEELSGGIWVFETEDGGRYQMAGGDKKLLKNGQKATVTGELDSMGMGIGMIGEILKVKSYKLESK